MSERIVKGMSANTGPRDLLQVERAEGTGSVDLMASVSEAARSVPVADVSKDLADLETGGEYRGCIEVISRDQISGWCVNLKDSKEPVKLIATIMGVEVGIIWTSHERPDLKRQMNRPVKPGFVLNWRSIDKDILKIILPLLNDAPNAELNIRGAIEIRLDTSGARLPFASNAKRIDLDVRGLRSVLGKIIETVGTYSRLAGGAKDNDLAASTISYRSLVQHVSSYDQPSLSAAANLALFVTYSATGAFYDYQRAQVAELRNAGYYVVGIHAAGTMSSRWLLSRLCDVDIFKANIGYDFGSWWTGIHWLDRVEPGLEHRLDSLILTNDSCFGSVKAAHIHTMRDNPSDLVGLCDSFQHFHHLQSFFVLCHGPLLRSGEFTRALRGYSFPSSKKDVVRFGELLLSTDAISVGADISAICEYRSLASNWLKRLPQKLAREKTFYKRLGFTSETAHQALEQRFLDILKLLREGGALNPSHVFWEEILLSGASFIKRELLLVNPADIPDYFSLCHACIQDKIISRDELKLYLATEQKSSLVPELIELIGGSP